MRISYIVSYAFALCKNDRLFFGINYLAKDKFFASFVQTYRDSQIRDKSQSRSQTFIFHSTKHRKEIMKILGTHEALQALAELLLSTAKDKKNLLKLKQRFCNRESVKTCAQKELISTIV